MNRRIRTPAILLAAAIATALIVAGCGGKTNTSNTNKPAATTPPATTAPARPATGTVAITLKEFSVTSSASTIHAGKVTFQVTNVGKAPHEFVVLHTTGAGVLPVKNGEASEAGHVGEIGNLNPGQSATLRLNLPPGHYVALCNFAGHYEAGMHVFFTSVAA